MQESMEIMEELLPKKSREVYKKVYEKFCEWKRQQKVEEVTEVVMLNYMLQQSKTSKSSSMWSCYSMLKACLIAFDNVDIGRFPKVKALLKQQSRGFKSKKSKVLSREEILRFFTEAPDEIYLLVKAVLVVGIAGGCRVAELTNMKIDDIEDRGSVLVITLPDTKTNKPRVFTIINDTTVNALDVFRKYRQLRPKTVSHRRLFLNYRNQKCTVQPVGENKIRSMPSVIASFLGLLEPKLYTGHAFRRTSASLLVDGGADLLELKRHGGWSSSTVAENYIVDSVEKKIQSCEKIFGKSCTSNLVSNVITISSKSVSTSEDETSTVPTTPTCSSAVVDGPSMTSSTFAKFGAGSIQNCNIFFLEKASLTDLSNLLR